ncbi:hypothetical protein IAD21_00901 [Abditibacteriota bacterium]|nr:hypothetical protein IAD21_00901 [Abditibacteriota bacterium]
MSKKPTVTFGKHKYPAPATERINQQFGKPKPATKSASEEAPPPPKEDEP